MDDIDVNLCSHLVYATADLDPINYIIKSHDPHLDLPDNNGLDNYHKFTALKRKKPGLKTLLGIHGWNDAKGTFKYSDLLASSISREKLIKKIIPDLKSYQFDGVSFDWAYPSSHQEDIKNFTVFIKEMYAAFKQHDLLLMTTVGADEIDSRNAYDIPTLARSVDFLHLMAYDFHGFWESQADHHAPLYKRNSDTNNYNVDYTVFYWINEGAPPEKLVLGIPLYGRSFTLGSRTGEKRPPIPASGPGIKGNITRVQGFLSYLEISSKIKEGWTVDSVSHKKYR